MDEFEKMIRKKFLEEGEIFADEIDDFRELTDADLKALQLAQKTLKKVIEQSELSKNDEL